MEIAVSIARFDGRGPHLGALQNVERDPVFGLADFYRKLWQRGDAGIEVSLDVLEGAEVRPTTVKSGNRYRYLHLDPTY